MAKSYGEVARILCEILERSGKPMVTIPWQDAYQLTDTKKWAASRTKGIEEAAYEVYGVIVASGSSCLFVMNDENFSPTSF